ncbi:MAG: hypothetical protein BWY89_01556 [Bacteroidetes bacterium ADurb.BinA012]|nr:MAG: hypothetical protein BWY89_01556 [Bacteroidetes bacterium ADurb.BinA012]
MAIVRTGTHDDIIPTAIPSIMVVAGPCWVCFAIPLVGLYSSEVKYSVDCPIMTPAASPATTAPNTPHEIQPINARMPTATRISAELPPVPSSNAFRRFF